MNRTVKFLLALLTLTFSFTAPCLACYDEAEDDFYDYCEDEDDDENDVYFTMLPNIDIWGIDRSNDGDSNSDDFKDSIWLPELVVTGSQDNDDNFVEGGDTYDGGSIPEVIVRGTNRTPSLNGWTNLAISWLNAHAHSNSTHKCAMYIRLALGAAGFNTTGHPQYAKDYGSFLKKLGFGEIPKEGYSPQVGDIRVWQNYPGGNIAGHIDMYNGTKWVSDFVEPIDDGPGRGYRLYNNYKIYRK
jgi:hypothetical protein